MKLPNKFKPVIAKQVQNGELVDAEILTSEQTKINAIIDYLTELHEQQKPCEKYKHLDWHKKDGTGQCIDCKRLPQS